MLKFHHQPLQFISTYWIFLCFISLNTCPYYRFYSSFVGITTVADGDDFRNTGGAASVTLISHRLRVDDGVSPRTEFPYYTYSIYSEFVRKISKLKFQCIFPKIDFLPNIYRIGSKYGG